MRLVWNETECAWMCSECGANYGTEEVARAFDYRDQVPENFNGGYCMDCADLWKKAIK